MLSYVNAICDGIAKKFNAAPSTIERINDALFDESDNFEVDGRELALRDFWLAAEHVIDADIREMEICAGNSSMSTGFFSLVGALLSFTRRLSPAIHHSTVNFTKSKSSKTQFLQTSLAFTNLPKWQS